MAQRNQDIQAFIDSNPNELDEFLQRNPVWRRRLLRRTAILTAKAWFEQGSSNNNEEIQVHSIHWIRLVDSLEAIILLRDPELLAVNVELDYNLPL